MGVDAAARGEPLIDLRGHSSRYRELPPAAPAEQAERRDSGSQPRSAAGQQRSRGARSARSGSW